MLLLIKEAVRQSWGHADVLAMPVEREEKSFLCNNLKIFFKKNSSATEDLIREKRPEAYKYL